MEDLRGTSIEYGKSLIRFITCLLIYSGIIFIAVTACAIALWTSGNTSPGAVVVAGSVAMRLMTIADWDSFSLVTIYTNLGEVEDAMHTLKPQHSLTDSESANDLKINSATVKFENITFAYVQKTGGIRNISLTIHSG